jgi:diadenosine tetraphosphate (Ap4A) HIT family hydrolase
MNILFPKGTILITKHFNIGQDWEIPISAFFIVSALDKSKRSIQDFTDDELIELILTIKQVRNAISNVLHIKDIYIFHYEDSRHGFHIWLFPRHGWMERFGRDIQSVHPIMNYAKEHMATNSNIKEVKNIIKNMKKYLSLR